MKNEQITTIYNKDERVDASCFDRCVQDAENCEKLANIKQHSNIIDLEKPAVIEHSDDILKDDLKKAQGCFRDTKYQAGQECYKQLLKTVQTKDKQLYGEIVSLCIIDLHFSKGFNCDHELIETIFEYVKTQVNENPKMVIKFSLVYVFHKHKDRLKDISVMLQNVIENNKIPARDLFEAYHNLGYIYCVSLKFCDKVDIHDIKKINNCFLQAILVVGQNKLIDKLYFKLNFCLKQIIKFYQHYQNDIKDIAEAMPCFTTILKQRVDYDLKEDDNTYLYKPTVCYLLKLLLLTNRPLTKSDYQYITTIKNIYRHNSSEIKKLCAQLEDPRYRYRRLYLSFVVVPFNLVKSVYRFFTFKYFKPLLPLLLPLIPLWLIGMWLVVNLVALFSFIFKLNKNKNVLLRTFRQYSLPKFEHT